MLLRPLFILYKEAVHCLLDIPFCRSDLLQHRVVVHYDLVGHKGNGFALVLRKAQGDGASAKERLVVVHKQDITQVIIAAVGGECKACDVPLARSFSTYVCALAVLFHLIRYGGHSIRTVH